MDPLQIQRDVRNNADELQDYLRDLRQWKDEMKRKEQQLNEQIFPEDEELPPIRGQKVKTKGKINVQSKNKKNKKDSVETTKEKPKEKRISSYDYAAWDKFDAKKACEEMDKEIEGEKRKEESDEESSENEDFETEYQKDQAVIEKEKGNEYFHMGKLEQAIECYTRGMLCDPMNPFLPANRALVLLKKEMYAAAEQDCDLAITIDKNYVKAYLRRGMARSHLKKVAEAREDFQVVLQLEPGNKQALIELSRLRQVEMQLDAEAQENTDEVTSPAKKIEITEIEGDDTTKISDSVPGLVQPVVKPPHLRSKKPLKRIEVEDMCMSSPEGGKEEIKKIPPLPLEVKFAATECPEELSIPVSPRTSYQFLADWKKLRRYKDKLFMYLKQIPPENYSSLFQMSLESEALSDILHILQSFYIKDGLDVYAPLSSLAKVERFQTLAMFLASDDIKVLRELFKHLESQMDKAKIAELEKAYGL